MLRKITAACCILFICLPVGAAAPKKPNKKSVAALLSAYRAYYGKPFTVTDSSAGEGITISIPDYDKIFSEEYPDFTEANNAEAARLDSAYQSLRSGKFPARISTTMCDSLLSTHGVISPLQSRSRKNIETAICLQVTDADGYRLELYGDKKRNLVAVMESETGNGRSEVVGSYTDIDLPYYGQRYIEQARAFAGANIALKRIDSLRRDYILEIADQERLARERKEHQAAEASARLEAQIKNFKPAGAVEEATLFLKSQGHSVGTPKNIVNHGARKVNVHADDFSRFTSALKAARSQLPVLRRTLAQTKEAGRYSAANRDILKKNVKELLQRNETTARAFRRATAEKTRKDIMVVTYKAGLVGEITLYANPDGSLNYFTWKDSAGRTRTEYPTLDSTMKVYGELADIVEALRRFAAANP